MQDWYWSPAYWSGLSRCTLGWRNWIKFRASSTQLLMVPMNLSFFALWQVLARYFHSHSLYQWWANQISRRMPLGLLFLMNYSKFQMSKSDIRFRCPQYCLHCSDEGALCQKWPATSQITWALLVSKLVNLPSTINHHQQNPPSPQRARTYSGEYYSLL